MGLWVDCEVGDSLVTQCHVAPGHCRKGGYLWGRKGGYPTSRVALCASPRDCPLDGRHLHSLVVTKRFSSAFSSSNDVFQFLLSHVKAHFRQVCFCQKQIYGSQRLIWQFLFALCVLQVLGLSCTLVFLLGLKL